MENNFSRKIDLTKIERRVPRDCFIRVQGDKNGKEQITCPRKESCVVEIMSGIDKVLCRRSYDVLNEELIISD
jgi:hypothetical protein